MRRLRPKRKPSSACPNCFRENEPVGYVADSHLYTFLCECGERWLVAAKQCVAHADWLGHVYRQRDVGDQ